jgi:hypothetical protein
MVQLVFPSSFKMDDFYTLIIYYYTYNIIYTFNFIQICYQKTLAPKLKLVFFA